MSRLLTTKFSVSRIRLARLAKGLLWPHPHLYFPYGILRRRGNSLNTDFDFYMGGYPRSANSFSRAAFLLSNPGAKILTHRHVPTFVLNLARHNVPGLVLVRKPLDAAVSLAIRTNRSLEDVLAYWNDYHRALLPVRSQLFMVRFEDVTKDFGAVMRAANDHWGTSFIPFLHTPENAARCFQITEEICRCEQGDVVETIVCRPSKFRRAVKETHLEQLVHSNFLRDELAKAQELYETFVSTSVRIQPEAAIAGRIAAQPMDESVLQASSIGI
jgi:hypothetical protein